MAAYRRVDQALKNAQRLREEIPILIQPEQSSFDLVTLADEVIKLRNIVEIQKTTIKLLELQIP